MLYIRQQYLPPLRQYKYSAVDRSLLSRYILKPFYNNVAIRAFPLWMAPNAITLTGFSFVIVNFSTLLWYNPTLDRDCPTWVYISWAVGLFLYQTFDAVDGTQARRTRQSGPLGESFDHGVDALNTALEVPLFAATMGLGQGWKTVLTLFACLFTFYIQTWDEYHTQTLYLGLVSGPVEGVLTLCIAFLLTAFNGGASFWQNSLFKTLHIPEYALIPSALYHLPWNEWFMAYGGLVLIYNTVQSTHNVATLRRGKSLPILPALLDYAPFLLTWTLAPLYLALNPSILHHHLLPFILYVGLINAQSVSQIILAHLLRAPFPYQNPLVWPLALGVLDSAGPWMQDRFGFGWQGVVGSEVAGVGPAGFVWACVGLGAGVYGMFVVVTIERICEYLDINCLSIKHPHVEGGDGEKKAR